MKTHLWKDIKRKRNERIQQQLVDLVTMHSSRLGIEISVVDSYFCWYDGAELKRSRTLDLNSITSSLANSFSEDEEDDIIERAAEVISQGICTQILTERDGLDFSTAFSFARSQ